MSFDIQSYRLGKRSVDKLVERLGRILGDRDTAELAGLLVGARGCGEVEERLRGYFAWQSLKWAYSPPGPAAQREDAPRDGSGMQGRNTRGRGLPAGAQPAARAWARGWRGWRIVGY